MLIWLLGFIVLSFLVYWLIIRRFRWRIVRLIVFIPLALFICSLTGFVNAWVDLQNQPTVEDIRAQVLEQTTVEKGNLIVSINAIGGLQPEKQTVLIFQASAPVTDILVQEGDLVEEGQLLASLDTVDLEQTVADAEIAFNAQMIAFNALNGEPREVDLAAARAAINAANASANAAYASGIDPTQAEIARLRGEISRNQLWQSQLQRDAITNPILTPLIQSPGGGFIPSVESPAPELDDSVEAINEAIDALNEQADGLLQDVNGALAASNQGAIIANQSQRASLESAVQNLEFGVQIADANYDATAGRGPDVGALASANAQRIQAEIALENLLNGPGDLRSQQANLDLLIAELTLEQARTALDQADLIAPFAGEIVQINLEVGQNPPQNAAMILIDKSNYYVDLAVDETDVVQIREGQRVVFSVDALPDITLTGQVIRVAFTPQQVGQLLTYNVRVRLDPTDAPILSGMSVTADIIVQERSDVILIPNQYVRIDRVTRDAFVIVETPGGDFVETMILLGQRNETYSEVLSGLEAGAVIVRLPREVEEIEGLFR